MINNLLISQMVYPKNTTEKNIKNWEKQLKIFHSGYAEIEKEYCFEENNFIYYFLISRTFDFPLEMVEREIEEDWHLLLSETMKEQVRIMKEEIKEE